MGFARVKGEGNPCRYAILGIRVGQEFFLETVDVTT